MELVDLNKSAPRPDLSMGFEVLAFRFLCFNEFLLVVHDGFHLILASVL